MDLDDQMRRYFGSDDFAAIPAEALAAGIEHMRVISASSGIGRAALPCGR